MGIEQKNPLTGKALAIGGGIIVVLLALISIIFAVAASSAKIEIVEPTCDFDVERVTVSRVVDGDTIEVIRNDGTEATVRLIGIDTPESVHPDTSKNTAEGDAASAHTKERLPEGTVIWLEQDVSDTDKYDRLLRYVWTTDPCTLSDPSILNTLNGELVNEGWAVPKRFEPDIKYADVLDTAYQMYLDALDNAAQTVEDLGQPSGNSNQNNNDAAENTDQSQSDEPNTNDTDNSTSNIEDQSTGNNNDDEIIEYRFY